jgi:hypothetical protein
MRRLISGVLAAVLLAAGCGSGGDGGDASATTTTTAPPGTTTTTAPTRIEGVLVALLTVRNKVFSAPDPARVGEYLLAECRCAEEDRTALAELKSKSHRWATPIVQLEGVRVAERKGPDEVVLTALASRPPEQIVDSTNTQVGLSKGRGLTPTGFRFVLMRKDGAWRIADVSPQDLPDEEKKKLFAEGIPDGPPDANSAP